MIMLMLLDVADMYLAPTLSAVSQLTNMRPRVAGGGAGGRVFLEGLGDGWCGALRGQYLRLCFFKIRDLAARVVSISYTGSYLHKGSWELGEWMMVCMQGRPGEAWAKWAGPPESLI